MIEKISNLLTGDKTLFLIDDITAHETLDKRRQPLLELAISGRHRGHSLWLLTQSYTSIPNNIRRQAKMLYIWYPKNRTDLNTIHEENDIIGLEELARVMHQSITITNIPPGQPPGIFPNFQPGFQLSPTFSPGFVPSEFPGGPLGVEPIT